MARVLAIDYGKKRVGIAVTDPIANNSQQFNYCSGTYHLEFFR